MCVCVREFVYMHICMYVRMYVCANMQLSEAWLRMRAHSLAGGGFKEMEVGHMCVCA